MIDLGPRLDRLAGRPEPCDASPSLFRLAEPGDREALSRLVDGGAVVRVRDTIADQLADWIKAKHPDRRWRASELLAEVDRARADRPAAELGAWVFYPWSGTLAHVLPEEAFRELRSARNCFKISPAEQAALGGRTIAVAGLSVGLAVVTTLALEGVGRRFRLADFDALGLSNLNRLRAGVPELGVNKAVLAARQLYELDPYLDVEVFPGGVDEGSIEAFLAPPLDLLVEECDGLAMKLRLREEARARRVPVLMETSDRGLIDVERFDREPSRPILHGLVGGLRASDFADLSAAEKVPVALRILDPGRLSIGLRASLPEIGRTIETWPQLASAVALGAGVAADAARRILLGQFTDSGRFYVDAASLVRDGAGIVVEPPAPTAERPSAPAVAELPPCLPRRASGPITEAEARFLAGQMILAPSAGNGQPWRFEFRGGTLSGHVLFDRSPPFLDFENRAAYLALGAAAENLTLAAGRLGLSVELEACPDPADPSLAFVARLSRGRQAPVDLELAAQIPLRVTNRKLGDRAPLEARERAALIAAASARDSTLQLLERPDELAMVADLMGRCDRHQLLTEAGHRDTMGELRFTPAEVSRTRDGLDVDALELSEPERVALGVLSDWPTMERLRDVGGGGVLEHPARRAVAASAAVGLVRTRGHGPSAAFRGGMAVQRLWLTASRLGLAVQPWTGLPYLIARVESGCKTGLSDDEFDRFSGLREEYRALFPADRDGMDLFLFRIARAQPPTARSLRRPIEHAFRFHPPADSATEQPPEAVLL